MTHTKDEALKLAKECGATTYTNRHYPDATAVTFSPLAWEKFCEQALAAQPAPVPPVAWAEYNFKEGKFTGLTTDDINSVDSVGNWCQWVPQLQALAAQPAPVQPVAWIDSVMEQAQVFASAWSLVGTWFESGSGLEDAEQAKAELRAMLATPPAAQRQWVGLTDEEFDDLRDNNFGVSPLISAVEAKLKEKNAAAQPAVPDAMTSADIQEHIEYVAGWNDCRQAMLEMMK